MQEPLNRRGFVKEVAKGMVMAGALGGVAVVEGQGAAQGEVAKSFPEFPELKAKQFRATHVGGQPSFHSVGKISVETMQGHYTLYQGYVGRLNLIRKKLQSVSLDSKDANQTYSDLRELKVELTFAVGGVKNHEIYFSNLDGQGTSPGDPLMKQIASDFGSFDQWKADLKATGIAGRGWAWLAWDRDEGRLFNYIGDSQNTFPIWNATPILALDVYEHAYWRDFGTNRAAYIDEFLNVLNWDDVRTRLANIMGK